MRKRSKHTQYFRPPIGKKRSEWVEMMVSLLFCFMSGGLIYLSDTNPPDRLLSISGAAEARTPIYSRTKALTGFRFCIGNPCMTFTYQQPGPRVEEVWAAVERDPQVTVLYAARADRNPRLWGIEMAGRRFTTTEELRDARGGQQVTALLVFIVSAAVAAYFIARACKRRTT